MPPLFFFFHKTLPLCFTPSHTLPLCFTPTAINGCMQTPHYMTWIMRLAEQHGTTTLYVCMGCVWCFCVYNYLVCVYGVGMVFLCVQLPCMCVWGVYAGCVWVCAWCTWTYKPLPPLPTPFPIHTHTHTHAPHRNYSQVTHPLDPLYMAHTAHTSTS